MQFSICFSEEKKLVLKFCREGLILLGEDDHLLQCKSAYRAAYLNTNAHTLVNFPPICIISSFAFEMYCM